MILLPPPVIDAPARKTLNWIELNRKQWFTIVIDAIGLRMIQVGIWLPVPDWFFGSSDQPSEWRGGTAPWLLKSFSENQ